MDTIVAGFTRLTDTAYPNSAFWNPGKAEIRRLGFTESGSFTWFEAVRRDDIADDEEALLVAMKDSGSALTVKPLAAAGTADKYVLAWEKKEAPGFRLAVLDSSLNAVNKISIYGIDTVYLGEALVVVEGISQNAALFATLGVRASGSSDMREVVISIFAYPTAYLRDGPP
ncbi:MAG TPA: hypothetical protein DCG47_03055 [Spirochaetaceae bacterium]|nr:hypothetical protein [Spirochaetaceae bacterium]